MKTYQTAINISADTNRVWAVLTREMPMNPTPYGIRRFDGVVTQGARIKIWSDVAPDRAFALTVATFKPPNTMVWKGGMPFGLFTGTRTFSLLPEPDGCRFEMQEVFTGPLSGVITGSMPDLTASFENFAQTLKAEAEKHE